MANAPLPDTNGPSQEAIREHLQAVLRSSSFINAARAQRFLTHIVERTLEGHTDAIKESLIGLEVFDRPADFDPKIDTVVRVEAGKLRKRLEEYYSGQGAGASLRIEVPKGGYVPRFQLQPQAPDPAPATAPVRRFPYKIVLAAGLTAAALAGAAIFWPRPSPDKSIAVLPFLNLSGDAADEYFADGMSEELTDALCNAGGLRVVSRTSAFFFKGKQAGVQEIGRTLRAAYVVEGSVRRQGPRLKVTAQLIRSDNGYHVWSGSFERQMANVFEVQREIAESLTAELRAKTASADRGADQRRAAKNPHSATQESFDLYLRGKHALNSPRRADSDSAEALFQQAIAADPAYAPPHAALAELYFRAGITTDRPPADLYFKANAAIHRAIELDPGLADAHALWGALSARHDHDLAAAERHLRRALRLNPNSSMAHYQLAHNVLAPQERWPEALAENRAASELDPLSPLIQNSQPWLAVLRRDHKTAVEGFRKLAEASPGDPMAVSGLVAALMGQGDYPAALKVLHERQRSTPNYTLIALIGHAEGRSGNAAGAREALRELTAAAVTKKVPPMCFALVYLGTGEADGAFRYLELARRNDDFSYLIYARVAHLYDRVRPDPRFRELLSSIGLSDEQIKRNQRDSVVEQGA